MAFEDSLIVIWIIDYTITPGIICLLFFFFAKKFKYLHNLWVSFLLRFISRRESKYMERVKSTLLSSLHDIVSSDWKLRNLGVIRILEIGPGVGQTFKYYPKNCHLIVYEPNPFIRPYFEKNKKKYPEVRLESYVAAGAENMQDVPDCTVDAVVSIGVLCAVSDVQKTLQEIRRVLVPKGQFFYVEHNCHKPHTWQNLIQRLVNPLWYLAFGCNVCRDLAFFVQQASFSEVHQYQQYAPWSRLFNIVLYPTLIGVATK